MERGLPLLDRPLEADRDHLLLNGWVNFLSNDRHEKAMMQHPGEGGHIGGNNAYLYLNKAGNWYVSEHT